MNDPQGFLFAGKALGILSSFGYKNAVIASASLADHLGHGAHGAEGTPGSGLEQGHYHQTDDGGGEHNIWGTSKNYPFAVWTDLLPEHAF